MHALYKSLCNLHFLIKYLSLSLSLSNITFKMASDRKLFLFVAFLACSSLDCCKAKARPLASISNLSTRLKLDEGSPDCWNSLLQLQACTGEIVLFFLSGETQLGRICCQALSTIGEHWWPSMIDTLGFNTEESQILEGYCDKAVDSTAPSPPAAPSVVPVKIVPKQTLVPWFEFEVSC